MPSIKSTFMAAALCATLLTPAVFALPLAVESNSVSITERGLDSEVYDGLMEKRDVDMLQDLVLRELERRSLMEVNSHPTVLLPRAIRPVQAPEPYVDLNQVRYIPNKALEDIHRTGPPVRPVKQEEKEKPKVKKLDKEEEEEQVTPKITKKQPRHGSGWKRSVRMPQQLRKRAQNQYEQYQQQQQGTSIRAAVKGVIENKFERAIVNSHVAQGVDQAFKNAQYNNNNNNNNNNGQGYAALRKRAQNQYEQYQQQQQQGTSIRAAVKGVMENKFEHAIVNSHLAQGVDQAFQNAQYSNGQGYPSQQRY